MYILKEGDLFPPIDATVKDEDDIVVDVTGATVKFAMRKARAPASIKINLVAGSIVDGPAGQIRYTMSGTDTDTPGTYEGEFQVVLPGGSTMRLPTEGYIVVVVEEKTN